MGAGTSASRAPLYCQTQRSAVRRWRKLGSGPVGAEIHVLTPKAPARRAQPDPPVSGLAVTSTAKPPGSVPSLGKGCLLLEEQHCGPYAHPVSCDQRNLFQSPCDPPLTVQALRSYLPNGPQSVGNSMPSASNGPSFAGRGRVQAETDRFSVGVGPHGPSPPRPSRPRKPQP